MIIDFGMNWENFYTDNIVGYIKSLQENPFELITLIIDLASAPGGVDYEIAEKLGIKAILASALPGKVAPDTASDYIKEYVYRKILF